MAAAIVPLVAGLAPTIINLITSLVHRNAPIAEAKLGNGTGPVKFADVFGAVIVALQSAAAAGTIDKQLPSDESVKLIIQAVVSSMKLQGQLDTTPAPIAVTGVASGNHSVTLLSGQKLTVIVP